MAIPELQDSSGRLTDCIYFGDRLSANVGSGFVPNARTISTTAPLTGGGDLSNNRTFAITQFAGSTPGSVPTSVGGTTNFLRADGSWAAPAVFTDVANGYTPASGGGTTNYLRADGTWAAPPGAGIAGLTTDYIPIATSATAIGNSRMFQTASGMDIPLVGGVIANAGLRVSGDATYGTWLKAYDSIGGFYISSLTLMGGGISDARVQIAADVTVGPNLNVEEFLYFNQKTVTVANGLNSDINLIANPGTNVRLIGPTAQFSVGGFMLSGIGALLVIHNTTAQLMTIVNEDLASFADNRIMTLTGEDVTLPANGSAAIFQYSTAESRWILLATNPAAIPGLTTGVIPYYAATGTYENSDLVYDTGTTRFGFGTTTPKSKVDINGTFAVRETARTLANGLNSNIPVLSGFIRITGPTGAFSVGGLAREASSSGDFVCLYNATAQPMTIVNEDASSTAAYRILTLTGANVVLPSRTSSATFRYSAVASRWVLVDVGYGTAAGATTQVQFNSSGALSADSGLTVTGTGTSLALTIGTGVSLFRKAANHLELGIPSATPAAQIVAGNSARGGTDSNKKGGSLQVAGGAGTGTGGGGDLKLATAYPGSLGNTQNSVTERLAIAANPVALTDSAANSVLTVGVPTETGSGGTLYYTIYATDGTDMQIRRGRVLWGAVNKASTITIVLGTPEEVDCTPVGTLTVTVATVDNADDTFDFQLTPVTSLTPTTYEAWITLEHDGKGAVTTV